MDYTVSLQKFKLYASTPKSSGNLSLRIYRGIIQIYVVERIFVYKIVIVTSFFYILSIKIQGAKKNAISNF